MGGELIESFVGLLNSIPFKELAVGILGAIIGGHFTLKGARESHALEFARERVRTLESAKKALILIKIEITSAWDVFYFEYGEEILAGKTGSPNLSILPLSDTNFVVYESLLGELSFIDSEVSEMIVRIYSRARGLVENIKMNNHEAEQCCKVASEYVQSIDKDLMSMAGSRSDESVRAEHYSMKAIEHAEIINMGSTSQAVRDLAGEVKTALDLLEPAIEKAIRNLEEQILLVRAKSKID